MDDLELYPSINPIRTLANGARALRANWKRVVAYGLVLAVVFGAAGYKWVTTSTPMDQTRAIELFRAESDATASADESRNKGASSGPSRKAGERTKGAHGGKTSKSSGSAAVMASQQRRPASESRSQTSSVDRSRQTFTMPEEGVYSWATDGYEQVSGARRQFPKESQRIITLEGDRSWLVHHYFSEEREIWTHFNWGSRGAAITRQRNKVTFGPVTNESTIDFAPPMVVAPKDLEVGLEWSDTWSGETHGDYSSRIFEHTTMDIGGEKVEGWGMAYEINLHGKQEGQVLAKVWLAPEYSLTVREYYKQDIESSGARYQAEWTQQLKSLEPQR
jgi:hypothetical protein